MMEKNVESDMKTWGSYGFIGFAKKQAELPFKSLHVAVQTSVNPNPKPNWCPIPLICLQNQDSASCAQILSSRLIFPPNDKLAPSIPMISTSPISRL